MREKIQTLTLRRQRSSPTGTKYLENRQGESNKVHTTSKKMIRGLAILALAAVCVATPTAEDPSKEFNSVKASKWVDNLLKHIYQHGKLDPEIFEIVHGWDIEANLGDDDNKWQLANRILWSRYKSGMLPRGEIYAVHYPELLEEAILMFNSFYHAPSYGDLMGIVYWAHTNLNEYQFNYALYFALTHSPITKTIALPMPYQIGPEYFLNSDVMRKIHDYKMGLIYEGDTEENHRVKIIEANYTDWYIKDTLDREHDLAYFMEDIHLNNWYSRFNVEYPFWMSSKEYANVLPNVRGEIYYFTHKALVNRYQLELVSHGMGEIGIVDWNEPVTIGYSPSMTYRNGMHFPGRPAGARIPVWKSEDLQRLREFELRIAEVADSGYMRTKDGKFVNISSEEGFNKFANLVQGNKDSLNENFYGSVDFLSRRVLGFSPKPKASRRVLPSALENSSTSLRDPGFYRVFKKIISFFHTFKKQMVPYSEEELKFDEVNIDSVNIVEKQLITYFEPFETLIETMAWNDHKNVTKTTDIKVRQHRLNHKPFTYEMKINSARDAKASVRIFLGPKSNLYGDDMSHNYEKFWQTDYFVVDLKKGLNTIERKSIDAVWFKPDHTNVEIAGGKLESAFSRRHGDIPAHLLLPRGTPEGMGINFFFHVAELIEAVNQESEPPVKNFDGKSYGFPLDRPMSNYSQPNMYLLDATITHKEEAQINLTNQ